MWAPTRKDIDKVHTVLGKYHCCLINNDALLQCYCMGIHIFKYDYLFSACSISIALTLMIVGVDNGNTRLLKSIGNHTLVAKVVNPFHLSLIVLKSGKMFD